MPELPEVETVARQLRPAVSGRRLKSVTVRDAKLDGTDWSRAKGYTIDTVRRVGKRVVFDLTGPGKKPPLWIGVHLRMTGRLIWCPAGWQPEDVAPDALVYKRAVTEKSLRLIFHLEGGELRFYDARRFGTVELHETEPQLSGAALEPLSKEFTAKALGALLAGAKGEIKPWMLRQDRLAGMGNIYASEALFRAGIDPRRSGGSLDAGEVKRLRDATVAVLKKSLEKRGTSFSDYQDSRGRAGRFQNFLQVYKRAGQPCRVCGTEIRQITQQQRSTFYCPTCQG